MEPEEDNKNQKEEGEEGELDEEEEILSSWTGLQPEKWGKLTFFVVREKYYMAFYGKILVLPCRVHSKLCIFQC